jgi:hypothetical protein
MPSLDLTMNLLAHDPAEGPYDLLFELIVMGVIGLLFLGGLIFLLTTIWRVLKKERPPK